VRKAALWLLVALVARAAFWGPAILLAQVNGGTAPYTFNANTTISSAEVNANFSTIYANALDRTGGTMTGTLNARHVLPVADNTYDLGSSSYRWANLYVVGAVNAASGGTFAAPVSVTSSTTPQLVVAYDSSNKVNVSVSAAGNATWDATGTLTVADNTTFSGTQTTTGAATFNGAVTTNATLSAAGASTGLAVTNNATVGGTLGVTGALTASGGLTATGVTVGAGPVKLPVTTYTSSPATVSTTDVFVTQTAAGATTLNLYTCVAGAKGNVVWIDNAGSGTLTVDPYASETINGASTRDLTTRTGAFVLCDGAGDWHVR